MVIPFVAFKMFGEVSDPLTEKGNLNLGGTRILFVVTVLTDNLLLFFQNKCHTFFSFSDNEDSPA
jgi:hypothetical protein